MPPHPKEYTREVASDRPPASFPSRLTSRLLAWHLKPIDTQNYDFLDGLRGVAILLVLAAHALYIGVNSSIYVRFCGQLPSEGGCGVTLFFCLSGYLVSPPF